jgi:DsbC/DsbD-like thiol-disulfide interchange protein
VGYGYRDEVLLPVTIDVPPDLRSGATVTLSAHASWLVCSETCIREDADLSIAPPIGAISEADQQWAGAFASTFARRLWRNPFSGTESKRSIGGLPKKSAQSRNREDRER